jgi:hypothetical protein
MWAQPIVSKGELVDKKGIALIRPGAADSEQQKQAG